MFKLIYGGRTRALKFHIVMQLGMAKNLYVRAKLTYSC